MIPHNRPTLGQRETEATTRSSVWLGGTGGKRLRHLKMSYANFSNSRPDMWFFQWLCRALPCTLGAGCSRQTVGIPVYSCASLRNAVGMAQAKPVYLDCHPHSVNGTLTRQD